ncbi:hypothetical protein WJX75_005254 [Coccomyxa subellipsoidea]|uniref:Uncharacterized protein n=1 Tax=Coccomyxa subellipsoidea TaxID=248742 RepID=A0ABR2Z3Q2_9CHLO
MAMTATTLAATTGKQQRAAGRISGQVGGPVNYAIYSFWIFISFAGWAIALGSMSALQHYENKTGISDGPNGWAIKANFPNLNSGRVFRLDWWNVFYQFIVSMLVVIATLSKVLPQARVAVCGYLAIATVLDIISADRFYNLSHFHITKAYWSSSRGAMSGFIIAATADYAMLYMAGLTPPPPET